MMQMTMEAALPGKRSDNREALDACFRRIYQLFGEASGDAVRRLIIEELGGLRVTVPAMKDLYREERDRRITAMFNGANHKELAIMFGISETQIRRILK